jgi:hypothetical protein
MSCDTHVGPVGCPLPARALLNGKELDQGWTMAGADLLRRAQPHIRFGLSGRASGEVGTGGVAVTRDRPAKSVVQVFEDGGVRDTLQQQADAAATTAAAALWSLTDDETVACLQVVHRWEKQVTALKARLVGEAVIRDIPARQVTAGRPAGYAPRCCSICNRPGS